MGKKSKLKAEIARLERINAGLIEAAQLEDIELKTKIERLTDIAVEVKSEMLTRKNSLKVFLRVRRTCMMVTNHHTNHQNENQSKFDEGYVKAMDEVIIYLKERY